MLPPINTSKFIRISIDVLIVLGGFLASFGLQLGAQNLSKIGSKLASSWSSILQWFWHRFFYVFPHLGTSKTEPPPRRESNFAGSILFALSSFLCSISYPKRYPKSSSRGCKIESKTSFEKTCRLGCDYEANLVPTWLQLGVMLAPKNDQNRSLRPCLLYTSPSPRD